MNRALAEMDLNEPSRGRAALVSTVTWSEEQKYLWSGGRIHPAFIQCFYFIHPRRPPGPPDGRTGDRGAGSAH